MQCNSRNFKSIHRAQKLLAANMVSEHSLNVKVTKLKTERYSPFFAVSIPLVDRLWFSGQAKSPTTVNFALAEIQFLLVICI